MEIQRKIMTTTQNFVQTKIRLTEKILYSIYYVLCMLVWQAINSPGFWIVLHLFCVGVANWCV